MERIPVEAIEQPELRERAEIIHNLSQTINHMSATSLLVDIGQLDQQIIQLNHEIHAKRYLTALLASQSFRPSYSFNSVHFPWSLGREIPALATAVKSKKQKKSHPYVNSFPLVVSERLQEALRVVGTQKLSSAQKDELANDIYTKTGFRLRKRQISDWFYRRQKKQKAKI
jgi:hypothetical protein